MSRMPEGFLWGGTTTANQYEGGYLKRGRGLARADPNVNGETDGNVFSALKNPYLKASERSWQINPLGLRIAMNVMHDCYQKLLFIVENVLRAVDTPNASAYVEDDYRIKYLRKHIE